LSVAEDAQLANVDEPCAREHLSLLPDFEAVLLPTDVHALLTDVDRALRRVPRH
jgi:hypothetical protein